MQLHCPVGEYIGMRGESTVKWDGPAEIGMVGQFADV